MTWGELKAIAEAAGITDSTRIGFIDLDPGWVENDVQIVFEDYPEGEEVTISN